MATEGGAAAAGDRDRLGRIEPGRHADLVLLDLDSLAFTPLNDPLRQLAFGSTAAAVHSVLVAGRFSLRDGGLTGIDEQAVLAEAHELGEEIVARHDDAFEVGRQLLASVREGWLEAMRADVGVERKAVLR
jgi:cytosine/adenosine deaminase-related metal-dependent hydrolase